MALARDLLKGGWEDSHLIPKTGLFCSSSTRCIIFLVLIWFPAADRSAHSSIDFRRSWPLSLARQMALEEIIARQIEVMRKLVGLENKLAEPSANPIPRQGPAPGSVELATRDSLAWPNV